MLFLIIFSSTKSFELLPKGVIMLKEKYLKNLEMSFKSFTHCFLFCFHFPIFVPNSYCCRKRICPGAQKPRWTGCSVLVRRVQATASPLVRVHSPWCALPPVFATWPQWTVGDAALPVASWTQWPRAFGDTDNTVSRRDGGRSSLLQGLCGRRPKSKF